jgi:NADH dehydrogenase FAD-containing subunit
LEHAGAEHVDIDVPFQVADWMSTTPSNASVPRVVIVGAGFGGLAAAMQLGSAPAEMSVIDTRNYNLFQPLLYQVATAALSPADIAAPIRSILRDHANTRVLLDEVISVDRTLRKVRTRSGAELGYDILVIATGSTDNYFGHEDWRPFARGLKCIEDAQAIRRHVLLAYERAEMEADTAVRDRLLTFVLVGGGPTGVEMAGALAELARAALARDFRRIDPKDTRIILVEAGKKLLAEFPDRLSDFARRSLERMGVEVRVGSPIERIDAQGAVAKGQRIEAATVIWCAGVKAGPVAQWVGIAPVKSGKIEVGPDLSLPGDANVFIIGDAAECPGADGKPLPGLAAVAKQQGEYVGALIRRRLRSESSPGPFQYRDRGTLATIGRHSAVARLPHISLTGTVAWILWGVVHLYFLIGFRNRAAVFLNWVWAWLTYSRGARLIIGAAGRAAAGPDARTRDEAA